MQAILEDCPQKYKQCLSNDKDKGPFGLYLFDLARYLFCEKILKAHSNPKSFPDVLIKDQLFQIESKEEFEELLKIKYIDHPIFENFESFSAILAKFQELNIENYPFKEMLMEELLARDMNSLFRIQWIDEEIGFGVFAKQDIPEKLLIGEYAGRVSKPFPRGNPYSLLIQEFKDHNIVITSNTHGNFTRFINHSSKPNLIPDKTFHKGLYRCFFWTAHEIKKGCQLTFHYGSSYWKKREKLVRRFS